MKELVSPIIGDFCAESESFDKRPSIPIDFENHLSGALCVCVCGVGVGVANGGREQDSEGDNAVAVGIIDPQPCCVVR